MALPILVWIYVVFDRISGGNVSCHVSAFKINYLCVLNHMNNVITEVY